MDEVTKRTRRPAANRSSKSGLQLFGSRRKLSLTAVSGIVATADFFAGSGQQMQNRRGRNFGIRMTPGKALSRAIEQQATKP
jgi:hypothetical protein